MWTLWRVRGVVWLLAVEALHGSESHGIAGAWEWFSAMRPYYDDGMAPRAAFYEEQSCA